MIRQPCLSASRPCVVERISGLGLVPNAMIIVSTFRTNSLPARKEEVEHAEEEGIVFKTLTNPTEVLGDENGWVKGMTCVEMELGEPDASGRRRPIVKEGSEFVLNVDAFVR